jgi:acyl-CoA synthetase (AMP-forming)/AMP-acid ligase II
MDGTKRGLFAQFQLSATFQLITSQCWYGQRFLGFIPNYHIFGLSNIFLYSAAIGATVVVVPKAGQLPPTLLTYSPMTLCKLV